MLLDVVMLRMMMMGLVGCVLKDIVLGLEEVIVDGTLVV